MIRTKEEMLDLVNKYIGEDTSEEAIGLIEDISDSYDSFSDPEDWKAKYEELDEAWKKKYKERFFEGSNKTPTGEDVDGETHEEAEEKELVTYDDFFESIEVKE